MNFTNIISSNSVILEMLAADGRVIFVSSWKARSKYLKDQLKEIVMVKMKEEISLEILSWIK